MAVAHPVLGNLSAAAFLDRYWQQQPLFIRGAMPDYASPVTAQELAGLALESEVESRLITGSSNAVSQQDRRVLAKVSDRPSWQLRQGPFVEQDFLALPDSGWTLLVQALDLWVPEVQQLRARFDFLPAWRCDDVMASYAVPGGSVGPHFDQYDVFLLQVEGARRWQVGQRCNVHTPLQAGTDLRIVADFEPQQDWLLEPGDMLYLPPGLSHWGVAQSECLTFSVGFRGPSQSELLSDLAVELLAQGNDRHYVDPPLTPDMAQEAIDPAFVAQAQALIRSLADDEALIADWFARYMTMPKYAGLEDLTEESRTARIGARRYRNGDLMDPNADEAAD